jgi:hypothetical protein
MVSLAPEEDLQLWVQYYWHLGFSEKTLSSMFWTTLINLSMALGMCLLPVLFKETDSFEAQSLCSESAQNLI